MVGGAVAVAVVYGVVSAAIVVVGLSYGLRVLVVVGVVVVVGGGGAVE